MKNPKPFVLAVLLLTLAAHSPPALAQSQGISGERCYARITRSKQAITLNPNQVGNFPTLDVRPQTLVGVEIIYTAGLVNEAVALTALEGGTFGNGKTTQDVTLDSLKRASFSFAAGSGRGLYRVSVRKGTDVKLLEFWVGEPLTKANE